MTWKNDIFGLLLPEYIILIFFGTVSSWTVLTGRLPDTNLLYPFLSLSLASLGLNVTNNIVDIKLDKINKPDRPLPTGRISARSAMIIAVVFIILSALVGLMSNITVFFLSIIFSAISILYSSPPFMLRKFLLTDSLFGGILYGLFPFVAMWSVSDSHFPFWFALLFFGFLFFIAESKNFEDIEGEKKYRYKTLQIVWGKKIACYFICFGLVLLSLVSLLLSIIGGINKIYFYSSIISLAIGIVYFKFMLTNTAKIEKMVISQSKIVTISMLTVILMQLSYGVASLFI